MDLNPENPNFSHIFKVDISTAIKVKAIIKDERHEWEEEFLASSLENAEKEIKEVMSYYNGTMRRGDIPRTFVRMV